MSLHWGHIDAALEVHDAWLVELWLISLVAHVNNELWWIVFVAHVNHVRVLGLEHEGQIDAQNKAWNNCQLSEAAI